VGVHLVVAPAERGSDAFALRPRAAILEGARPSFNAASGYERRRYLMLPRVDDAEHVIPYGSGNAARYAARHTLGGHWWKAARNRAAGELLARGLLPSHRSVTTVVEHTLREPFLVAAAAQLGVEPGARWFVSLGHRGEARSRGVFFLFPSRSTEPEWIVKFARVPGARWQFDNEERVLTLVERAGADVAAGAPRFLGRIDAAGFAASVELAARGTRLDRFLGGASARADKLAVVDRVAAWAVALAGCRAADTSIPESRVLRLANDVFPRWYPDEVGASLADQLRPVPAVVQHQDLGSYNVLYDGPGFTALDWEAACTDGFPLWDLLQFLHDALARVDGAWDSGRDEHAVALFRGELDSSRALFKWVREAATTSGLDGGAVAALAAAVWPSICDYHLAPGEPVPARGSARFAALPASARMAVLWRETAGLGVEWTVWQR
jgi:hypothetical protein